MKNDRRYLYYIFYFAGYVISQMASNAFLIMAVLVMDLFLFANYSISIRLAIIFIAFLGSGAPSVGFFLGNILQVLKSKRLLPDMFFIEYALEFGSTSEVMLFSFAPEGQST